MTAARTRPTSASSSLISATRGRFYAGRVKRVRFEAFRLTGAPALEERDLRADQERRQDEHRDGHCRRATEAEVLEPVLVNVEWQEERGELGTAFGDDE